MTVCPKEGEGGVAEKVDLLDLIVIKRKNKY
jgi:hypothetical protein